jgi:hypothetical protein
MSLTLFEYLYTKYDFLGQEGVKNFCNLVGMDPSCRGYDEEAVTLQFEILQAGDGQQREDCDSTIQNIFDRIQAALKNKDTLGNLLWILKNGLDAKQKDPGNPLSNMIPLKSDQYENSPAVHQALVELASAFNLDLTQSPKGLLFKFTPRHDKQAVMDIANKLHFLKMAKEVSLTATPNYGMSSTKKQESANSKAKPETSDQLRVQAYLKNQEAKKLGKTNLANSQPPNWNYPDQQPKPQNLNKVGMAAPQKPQAAPQKPQGAYQKALANPNAAIERIRQQKLQEFHNQQQGILAPAPQKPQAAPQKPQAAPQKPQGAYQKALANPNAAIERIRQQKLQEFHNQQQGKPVPARPQTQQQPKMPQQPQPIMPHQ